MMPTCRGCFVPMCTYLSKTAPDWPSTRQAKMSARVFALTVPTDAVAPVTVELHTFDRQWFGELGSVIPGVGRPVRDALFEERFFALGCLVGHVRQPGCLAGEQLLANESIVEQVERILQHALGGR